MYRPGKAIGRPVRKGWQSWLGQAGCHVRSNTLALHAVSWTISRCTGSTISGLILGQAVSPTRKSTWYRPAPRSFERCLLMTTDPGDLCLDPTCGSGTTAYVAEQWGRRWITCDTSRVALALARTRLMAAKYPYYLLADSPEGQQKETELTGQPSSIRRRSFVRRRSSVAHRLSSIIGHQKGLRLQARPARHPQIHRQQRGDRRASTRNGRRSSTSCAASSTRCSANPGKSGRSRATSKPWRKNWARRRRIPP